MQKLNLYLNSMNYTYQYRLESTRGEFIKHQGLPLNYFREKEFRSNHMDESESYWDREEAKEGTFTFKKGLRMGCTTLVDKKKKILYLPIL